MWKLGRNLVKWHDIIKVDVKKILLGCCGLNLAETSEERLGVTSIVVGYYRRLPKEAGEF
jgi:hypothetical protein